MMPLILAVALAGPPAPVLEPHPALRGYDARDAHRDAWKVCALTAVDLGATEAILASGGREHNPLVRNRAARIGVGALGCWALHDVARRDPEKARKWTKIGLVVRGLAAAWNIRQITARAASPDRIR